MSPLHEAAAHAKKLGYGTVENWIRSVPDSAERAAEVATEMLESAMEFAMSNGEDMPANLGPRMGDLDNFFEDL